MNTYIALHTFPTTKVSLQIANHHVQFPPGFAGLFVPGVLQCGAMSGSAADEASGMLDDSLSEREKRKLARFMMLDSAPSSKGAPLTPPKSPKRGKGSSAAADAVLRAVNVGTLVIVREDDEQWYFAHITDIKGARVRFLFRSLTHKLTMASPADSRPLSQLVR